MMISKSRYGLLEPLTKNSWLGQDSSSRIAQSESQVSLMLRWSLLALVGAGTTAWGPGLLSLGLELLHSPDFWELLALSYKS